MRVIIVGAGVFGSWSAKFLADAGHDVTLIDSYGPANSRASSADHSRVIRAGYGADENYSRWAAEAWPEWEWLASQSGRTLLTRCGALFLGEPGNQYVIDTYATLQRLGRSVELVDADSLRDRYPQIALDGLGPVVFEPDAGVVRAQRAVQSLVSLLVRNGDVEYAVGHVEPIDEERTNLVVRTRAGAVLSADAYVFACGPWLPTLFPHALRGRIRATRQEVLYFGVPRASVEFSAQQLPVWIDFGAGVYGIGDLEGRGFKVGIDRHGDLVDPDTLDRVVDATLVDSTRSWIGWRFPGMRGAPLVDARVCQYENTSSGDFIIDRHPMWQECWIVGGGSGHGFKHGPSVGRHVAALIDGNADVHERFSLRLKSTDAARVVF
jgi:monomeric sarcosine oxidase